MPLFHGFEQMSSSKIKYIERNIKYGGSVASDAAALKCLFHSFEEISTGSAAEKMDFWHPSPCCHKRGEAHLKCIGSATLRDFWKRPSLSFPSSSALLCQSALRYLASESHIQSLASESHIQSLASESHIQLSKSLRINVFFKLKHLRNILFGNTKNTHICPNTEDLIFPKGFFYIV